MYKIFTHPICYSDCTTQNKRNSVKQNEIYFRSSCFKRVKSISSYKCYNLNMEDAE